VATDEAIELLSELAKASPPEVQAVIAEALGLANHPAARRLLAVLLNHADDDVACGAVRALAWQQGEETLTALLLLINNDGGRPRIRCEAARVLGTIGGAESCAALGHLVGSTTENAIAETALRALVARPLRETLNVLSGLLATARNDRRIALLDALGETPDDLSLLIAPCLADPASEVREAAALALATAVCPGSLGDVLVAALDTEPEAVVRVALYSALTTQMPFDVSRLVDVVEREPTRELRLAGWTAVATKIGSSTDQASRFDHAAVAELAAEALKPDSQHALTAVRALQIARTVSARAALVLIAEHSIDVVAREARVLVGL
jgi:HEAT repeat protein